LLTLSSGEGSPDAAAAHRIPCPTFRDDREASLRRAWDGVIDTANRNSGKEKYFQFCRLTA
jgi:hypothetical protein